MPEVLILCAHRPKRSPSQRYRFEQVLPYLEQHGFNFTFSYLLNQHDDRVFYSKARLPSKLFILLKSICIRIKDVFRFKTFDIIFIQREASFLGTSFFEKQAFLSGAYVIFDFDDSIWLADTSPGNKKWEWIKQPQKFFKNLGYANCVLAGNGYLVSKALGVNKNTQLIPTTIDTDFHVPKPELRNKNVICIGWSGSLSTIKHFELLIPVLKKLKEKYGDTIRFKLIGEKNYSHPLVEIEAVAWTAESEVDELNSLDIGLMPLKDDEWAQGKCGLKGLSYMACEVAAVMSAVGVNKEIIQHKQNGLLAKTDEEWFAGISELIENKALRLSLGKKGRETVIQNYSLEKYKDVYLNIFKGAQSTR